MKRKMLATLLAICMCLTPCYAFAEETGSDVTADEILQKSQEYAADVSSMSATAKINIDLGMKVSNTDEDGAVTEHDAGIKGSGSFDLQYILEPLSAVIKGALSLSADGEDTDMDLTEYIAATEDDSKVDVYAQVNIPGQENEGWEHMQQDVSEVLKQLGVSSFKELAQGANANEQLKAISDLITYEVEETDTEYILTSKTEGDTLTDAIMPLIQSYMESDSDTDDSDSSGVELMVSMVLGMFVINTKTVYDKETCAVKSMHIDLNDSDLDQLSAIASLAMGLDSSDDSGDDTDNDAGNDTSFYLNDLSMDVTYDDYNSVKSIEIPEEALKTEITNPEDDAADLGDMIEDLAETEMSETETAKADTAA